MPLDWESVIGKITRSLSSSSGLKVDSISSPYGLNTRSLIRGLEARRAVGSTVRLPSAAIVPARNVKDDTWPSPTARRLRMKRKPPFGASDWSGCGTMLGLNRAEASNEYSLRKYAPINWRWTLEKAP